MVDALFAYGTLESAEVLHAVCGSRPAGEPARLAGYACLRVRGAEYPAVVARPGCVTEGTLYRGLSAQAFARIDAYEGDLYVCRSLPVEPDAGVRLDARVYVLHEDASHLLDDVAWDRAAFAARAGR